jgi:hypothetical protein
MSRGWYAEGRRRYVGGSQQVPSIGLGGKEAEADQGQEEEARQGEEAGARQKKEAGARQGQEAGAMQWDGGRS